MYLSPRRLGERADSPGDGVECRGGLWISFNPHTAEQKALVRDWDPPGEGQALWASGAGSLPSRSESRVQVWGWNGEL